MPGRAATAKGAVFEVFCYVRLLRCAPARRRIGFAGSASQLVGSRTHNASWQSVEKCSRTPMCSTKRAEQWLAAHVRSNHVHAIIEAETRPERIMNDRELN